MKTSRTVTGLAALATLSLGMTGCSSSDAAAPAATSSSVEQQSVSVQMNWFAQAEQGGYWDAMENQYAKDSGVTLDVKQGGPSIQTVPQVASGQSDFGMGNADEILIALKSGLPIVVVASAYDTNLQCMMSHAALGIKTFSDLNGHQVSRAPLAYFDYIKAHFKLDNIQEINFNGSIADFKRNPDLIQQCYISAEPFTAQQQDIDINTLSVAKDGGYNPYGDILFTTEKFVKENPEVVKAVVDAVITGWKSFLKDPSAAKKAVMTANPDTDSPSFDYAAKTVKEGNYLGDDIGRMTDERWKTLRDQLATVNLVPADLDYTTAFTNDYLPE